MVLLLVQRYRSLVSFHYYIRVPAMVVTRLTVHYLKWDPFPYTYIQVY